MWGALSDKRTGLTFTSNCCWPSPVQSFSDPSDHILLSEFRDSPNLENQVPVYIYISPRNRVAQLYPQALGSLFVTSYESQGYGGVIRARPHTRRHRSLLSATSQHGHSWHRAPLVPMTKYLFSFKTFAFCPFSVVLLTDTRRGW
jgi:hypothetical protein